MKSTFSPDKAYLTWFTTLTRIPHESRNERQLSDFLVSFAKERGLEVTQDAIGNTLIRKPGTRGMENAPASDSAYNTGTWFVEAPGADPLKMDRLQFEDGVLVAHYYSDPNYGKGSYGPDSPDSVEFSPYYQKTVEEVIALLEGEGRTVTVSQ